MMFEKKIRYHWKSVREGRTGKYYSEHFRKSFCHRSLKKVSMLRQYLARFQWRKLPAFIKDHILCYNLNLLVYFLSGCSIISSGLIHVSDVLDVL